MKSDERFSILFFRSRYEAESAQVQVYIDTVCESKFKCAQHKQPLKYCTTLRGVYVIDEHMRCNYDIDTCSVGIQSTKAIFQVARHSEEESRLRENSK